MLILRILIDLIFLFLFFYSFSSRHSSIISDQMLSKMIDYFIFAFRLCHQQIDLIFFHFHTFLRDSIYYGHLMYRVQHTLEFVYRMNNNNNNKLWNLIKITRILFYQFFFEGGNICSPICLQCHFTSKGKEIKR